jgi:hypothetical protein
MADESNPVTPSSAPEPTAPAAPAPSAPEPSLPTAPDPGLVDFITKDGGE